MNFKSHALGALFAAILSFVMTTTLGSVFGVLEYFKLALVAAICAWIGAVFPDFDIGSIPARWFGRLGFFISCGLLGAGLATEQQKFFMIGSAPGLIALLSLAFKHRGPFHKYWLPFLLVGVAVAGHFLDAPYRGFVNPLILSFAGGMSVHLILDGIFPWSFKGWFL